LEHPNETLEIEIAELDFLQTYRNNNSNYLNQTLQTPTSTTTTMMLENIDATSNVLHKHRHKSITHASSTIQAILADSKLNATLKKFKEKWKNVQMNRLNTKVGLMFASKPIVQLITNPFIGPLTNRLTCLAY
jgi:hypothetical protein